jgi:hypothetical protein
MTGNLLSRLERLEAELANKSGPQARIVRYVVMPEDDPAAKRAEAQAEFNRRNPHWSPRPDGGVCLIERRIVRPDPVAA